MSATDLVRAQIEKFLKASDPDVICIRGPWGVGKTYLWKKTLERVAKDTQLPIEKYSYVSLFGIDSLESLKMSIYANQVELYSTAASWTRKKTKEAKPLLELIPKVGDIIKALGTFYFSTVRNQIICIDDLERRSSRLEVKDVLGLISYLKEERQCKIVLLLNDGELGDDGEDEFRRHFEKTIDIHVRFDATAEESAMIGVTTTDTLGQSIKRHCVTLGIINVRIIRKIDRAIRDLLPLLEGYDPAIVDSATRAVPLLTWTHLRGEGAPTIEHLRTRTGLTLLNFDKDKKLSAEEARWNTTLDDHNWGSLDALDKELIAAVDLGYYDPAKIKAAADDVQAVLAVQRQDGAFEDSWSGYHDSFEPNQDELLDHMFETFKKTYKTITLGNVDGTVRLFRDLGRDVQATELLAFYISNRQEPQTFWDLDDNPFGNDIKDSAFRQAVIDKFYSYGDLEVSLAGLLEAMGGRGGWNVADADKAAALPVEDYKKLFKTERGRNLRKIINGGLFGARSTVGDNSAVGKAVRKISESTIAALREIGAESALNARRVEHLYGVKVWQEPDGIEERDERDEGAR
jgi:hypothetical protein